MKKIAITLVIAIALLFCFGTVALAADGSCTGWPSCNNVTTGLSSLSNLTFCDSGNTCKSLNDMFSPLQSKLNTCLNGSCSGLSDLLNQFATKAAPTCSGSNCAANSDATTTTSNTGSGCWGGWDSDSSNWNWDSGGSSCTGSSCTGSDDPDTDDSACAGSDCSGNSYTWSGDLSGLIDWLNQQGWQVVTDDDSSNCTGDDCDNTGTDDTDANTGSGSNTGSDSGSGTVTTPPQDQQDETFAQAVFRLTNEQRVANGLPALKSMTILDKAATIRSAEQESIFSHTRPDGRSCFTVLEDLGISYTQAGENIAMGYTSPESVVTGWMNSPGHRANILNANFTTLGVGVYQGADGTLYWSQEFLTQ